jgi:uncharacterized membrane protein
MPSSARCRDHDRRAPPAAQPGGDHERQAGGVSDGVLAIVITLLAIELRPPEVHEGQTLASALGDQWPSYLAYLLAFDQIRVSG